MLIFFNVLLIISHLLHSAHSLTLITPFNQSILHEKKINLQIQPYSCPELGKSLQTLCWTIKSIEFPLRSKTINLCVHENRITAPHFLAIGGNIGNGTYSFTVQANDHDTANHYKELGYSDKRPYSNCKASGTFQLITTCANKVFNSQVKLSGMTNSIQTPPLHNAKCYEEWMNNMPTLYSMLDVLSSSRSTFGSHYTEQAFGHGDKLFVEFVMQRHEYFKNLVEFGTWTGVTSLFFGMIAGLRGGTLTTIDIADQRSLPVLNIWLDNMYFHLADLENENNVDKGTIKALTKADFLFNDGWNKHIEAKIYTDYLPLGAGYLEHDYSYDHTRSQKKYFLNKLGFEIMYEDVAIHFNSCARFWIRTSVPETSKAKVDRVAHLQKKPALNDNEIKDNDNLKMKNLEMERSFVQYAMQFENGRKLLSAWRKLEKDEKVEIP
jgi:hypothetical protein